MFINVAESQITEEERVGGTSARNGSDYNSEDVTPSSRSSRSNQHRSSRYDSTEYDMRRSDFRDHSRNESRGSRRYSTNRDERDYFESPRYGNKRSRYESSRRTPGHAASPWDCVAPLPVPIRASGSVRSSDSRSGGRSQQPHSAEYPLPSENEDFEQEKFHNPDITESMRLEMEYNSDRAWYDSEEGNTLFDADSSSFYLGDVASVQKKEAEVTKRLVRSDGTQMTLAQNKKLSQLTADNAQWEDRQLLRSGAVRGADRI